MAILISVGTELLLGDITNTNFSYLARELAALGIPLYREVSVGDNPDRLRTVLADALSSDDLVITTGGLGPTRDDLTKETAASLFGTSLIRDPKAVDNIIDRLRGRTLTENNLKQADLPDGCIPFYNSVGTAPGFALSRDDRTLMMLPGVPHEMKTMFREWVVPILRSRCPFTIYSRNLHVTGIGESTVDSLIGDLADSANPTVAPYCKAGETRLRISARAADAESARRMVDDMEEKLRATEAGQYVYFTTESGDDADRAPQLAAFTALRSAGLTVAFAESITGGLCAKLITDFPGASSVLRGSAVTYATETKTTVLGVKRETVEGCGVVSEECAAEMAAGARALWGSDIAVATTGLADDSFYPDGRGLEAGTVCIAIADVDGVEARTYRFRKHPREYVRELAAAAAMRWIAEKVRSEE